MRGAGSTGEGPGASRRTPRRKKHQPACKPGSVGPRRLRGGTWRPFLWDGACASPQATYPNGRVGHPAELSPESELSASPFLFGFAPGGVYPAALVAESAVRSYRTFSPLPAPRRRRFVLCGTFPGVAPAGRYPAPFVHGARTFLPRDLSVPAGAAARPTDAHVMECGGSGVKCGGGCGTLSSSARRVARVDMSAVPSTRSGRKWRWNAATTSAVAESYWPVRGTP